MLLLPAESERRPGHLTPLFISLPLDTREAALNDRASFICSTFDVRLINVPNTSQGGYVVAV